MGFDTQDLLRQAGYGEGDSVHSIDLNTGVTGSTSSNTYSVYRRIEMKANLNFAQLFVPGSTLEAVLYCSVQPSGDEIDVRLQNTSANETILEQTGFTTSQNVTIGPTEYTPTSPDQFTLIEPQFRNNDNTTTVDINRMSYYIATKLEP